MFSLDLKNNNEEWTLLINEELTNYYVTEYK